jgi:hypothetical protein
MPVMDSAKVTESKLFALDASASERQARDEGVDWHAGYREVLDARQEGAQRPCLER